MPTTEELHHPLDTANEALHTARDSISDRVQEVGGTADRITSTAVRTVKRYPVRSALIAAAVVAAAGFLAGVLTSQRT